MLRLFDVEATRLAAEFPCVTLSIKVDGQEVVRHRRWFSEPLKEAHQFVVGQEEIWSFKIEKERKLLFASMYRVFINNRLAKVCEGV